MFQVLLPGTHITESEKVALIEAFTEAAHRLGFAQVEVTQHFSYIGIFSNPA